MIVKTTNSVLFRFNKFMIIPKLFRLIIILYVSTTRTTSTVLLVIKLHDEFDLRKGFEFIFIFIMLYILYIYTYTHVW